MSAEPVVHSIDVEPLLADALAKRDAGDLGGADELIRRALDIDAGHPTALYLMGLSRFEAGDAGEAERLFGRLVAARPNHAQSHFLLASVRHWRDARTGAIAAYRHAVALDPAHAQALTGLSRALAESGDPAGALEPALAATAAAADDAGAHLALAAAYRGLGDVRKAAEAFQSASRLSPALAAAHVGEALARIDLGEAEAAEAAARRALALDANLADAWIALGAAQRGLHQPKAARESFERAVALDPNRPAAHLNLGLALIELEAAAPARDALTRVLELDPASALAHANLSSLYILAARPGLAKAHALRALEIDPQLMSAHQNLAALLADEREWEAARTHRDRAYSERNLVICTAARPLQRVLILSTTESGNIPDRHLIPPDAYTRLMWFIEYASERQMSELPAFDVAFNAIGDEDLAGPTAANAARFAELCPTRLVNPPAVISRTRRDRAAELFGGVGGVSVPRTVRLEAADLPGAGVRAAGDLARIEPPFLLRPVGSHGGKGLCLVGADAADAPLPPARAYYVTAFNDFRSADGLYRKYRMIFVDREPLPYHLAIASGWMVHYESSGMETQPERLAEELRFLSDPAGALGHDAMQAVAAIGRAMDLDYAGVDFSLTPDGEVLLFEANATMLAHPEATDGPLAHKNPYTQRIFAAFRAMLARPA